MLQDLEKGKATEVDAINGAVSDFGKKVGCPTPMNDLVVQLIHKIEQGELKQERENLKFFA
jgi:2-dehydropantoate 2-reductase